MKISIKILLYRLNHNIETNIIKIFLICKEVNILCIMNHFNAEYLFITILFHVVFNKISTLYVI